MTGPETCDMIQPHHTDCTCALCEAYEDPVCGKPAVGTTASGAVRVCAECATAMERDGFAVDYGEATNNGSPGPGQRV